MGGWVGGDQMLVHSHSRAAGAQMHGNVHGDYDEARTYSASQILLYVASQPRTGLSAHSNPFPPLKGLQGAYEHQNWTTE